MGEQDLGIESLGIGGIASEDPGVMAGALNNYFPNITQTLDEKFLKSQFYLPTALVLLGLSLLPVCFLNYLLYLS